jgi:hypothetical protein
LSTLSADAAPEDAALQHQRAKEMLQLTEWMAAVGQGHKDMLVRAVAVTYSSSIALEWAYSCGCTTYAAAYWYSTCFDLLVYCCGCKREGLQLSAFTCGSTDVFD